LLIKDDGIGFDITNGCKGNGLKNMQARAGEIAGVVKVTSIREEGTTVFLDCRPT
jgi:two-component system NarL family sensor kinase